MADKKISALTTAASPLAGTEVLPIVQSGSTVKVSVANLTATQDNIGVSTTPMNWGSAGHCDVPNDGGLFSKGPYNNVGANWYYNGAFKYQANGGASWYQQNTGYHVWYSAASGTAGATIASFPELMALWPTGDLKLASGNYVVSTAGKGIDFSANTHAAGMTSELLNWYEEGTWTPTFTAWPTAPTVYNATYTRIGRQVTLTIFASEGVNNYEPIGGIPFTSSANSGGAGVIANRTDATSAGTCAVFTSSTNIDSFNVTLTGKFWQLIVTYFV